MYLAEGWFGFVISHLPCFLFVFIHVVGVVDLFFLYNFKLFAMRTRACLVTIGGTFVISSILSVWYICFPSVDVHLFTNDISFIFFVLFQSQLICSPQLVFA
jgi:hypothetical protein